METKQKKKPVAGTKKTSPVRTAAAPKKRKLAPKAEPVKTGPDVVYLPPKPFSRNRLILHLATIAAVVLAVVLGLSIFFRVDENKITVSGGQKYSAWEVAQASGIKEGDNLLTFNRAKAAGRIQASLPYVKSVRIGIKLPDTVNIEIVEIDVTYSIKSVSGQWWLISAEGKAIEQVTEEAAASSTKILGVTILDPKVGEKTQSYQEPQTATTPDGNLVPITVTAAERLQAATDIAGFLESNGIFGEMASIDVNDVFDIQLWYGEQYQVKLGDRTDLGRKITYFKGALDQYLGVHDSGVLDITKPPQVLFTAF